MVEISMQVLVGLLCAAIIFIGLQLYILYYSSKKEQFSGIIPKVAVVPKLGEPDASSSNVIKNIESFNALPRDNIQELVKSIKHKQHTFMLQRGSFDAV